MSPSPTPPSFRAAVLLALFWLTGLLFGCVAVVTVLHRREPPPRPLLPDPDLQFDAWLSREVLPMSGSERTGAWRESFDRDGCHRQASNTWLWVHDPVLLGSSEPSLYWNRDWPERPDFCLGGAQRQRLEQALGQSGPASFAPPPSGWLERWTWSGPRAERVWVYPLGQPPAALLPVLETLASVARQGVWGQSPEPSVIDEEPGGT